MSLSLSSECCVLSAVSEIGLSFVKRSLTEGRFVYVCVSLIVIKGHNSLYTPTVIRKKERKKELVFCMQLINSKDSGL
jgi:hypothetical protein